MVSPNKIYCHTRTNTPLTLTDQQQKVLDLLEGTLMQRPVQSMWVERGRPDWACAYLQGCTNTAYSLIGRAEGRKFHTAWDILLQVCIDVPEELQTKSVTGPRGAEWDRDESLQHGHD